MDELIDDFKRLGCRDIITTKDEFEKCKNDYKHDYDIPFEVIARCGHKMTLSLYKMEARINNMCDNCETIDFETKYKFIKQRYEAFEGVKLVTTIDEMILNQLNINDAYVLEISNCANRGPGPHTRKSRYSDLKRLEDKTIVCTNCSRKLKNNGNLSYKELYDRFEKIGCKLLTTEDEYKNNSMSAKDSHSFIATCGHTVSDIPQNLDLKRRKTPIKCQSCK